MEIEVKTKYGVASGGKKENKVKEWMLIEVHQSTEEA